MEQEMKIVLHISENKVIDCKLVQGFNGSMDAVARQAETIAVEMVKKVYEKIGKPKIGGSPLTDDEIVDLIEDDGFVFLPENHIVILNPDTITKGLHQSMPITF